MTDGTRPGRTLQGFLREWIGLDARSLALMRMGLAGIMLLDLGIRVPFAEALYSDAGMVPRAILFEYSHRAPLELHALSGSPAFQLWLFAAATICALLLLVGRFTKAATFGCFALTASLHYRNPFILLGFDHILRVVLFWSIFLPLGECWSLDARRKGRTSQSTTVVSVASAALLLQVVIVYFMAGVAKSADEWVESFTAIEWVLHDSSWAFDHAAWFLGFPELLRAATVGTLVLEFGAPLLLLSPLLSSRIRTFGIAALCGLQLGIGSLMDLYLFPVINLVVLVGLIPNWAWVRLGGRDGNLGEIVGAASGVALRRTRDAFVAGCLLLVVWMNASFEIEAARPPGPFFWTIHALGIHQRWELYGPGPRRADKLSMFVGELANGELVERNSDAGHEAWKVVADIEGHYRYRLLTVFSLDKSFELYEVLRPAYAQWICDRWNLGASPERRMRNVRLVAVIRRLRFRRPPSEAKYFGFEPHTCRGTAETISN